PAAAKLYHLLSTHLECDATVLLNGRSIPAMDSIERAVRILPHSVIPESEWNVVLQETVSVCRNNARLETESASHIADLFYRHNDEKLAVEWYRKAAEQGYAAAQFNLGVSYAKGAGIAKDEKLAVEWYRKAAEQGDADARYGLGVCYANGV